MNQKGDVTRIFGGLKVTNNQNRAAPSEIQGGPMPT